MALTLLGLSGGPVHAGCCGAGCCGTLLLLLLLLLHVTAVLLGASRLACWLDRSFIMFLVTALDATALQHALCMHTVLHTWGGWGW